MSGLRTRGDVVESALFITSPRTISRRREAEEAECCSQRECRPREFDGAENSALLLAVGNTSTTERYFGHLEQRDEDAKHRKQLGVPCSQLDHLLLQRTLRHRIDVKGDDAFRWKSRPVPSSRAGAPLRSASWMSPVSHAIGLLHILALAALEMAHRKPRIHEYRAIVDRDRELCTKASLRRPEQKFHIDVRLDHRARSFVS